MSYIFILILDIAKYYLIRRINCDNCVDNMRISGLSAEYSELGLEARRRRHLSGRAEVGIHRAELSGARLLHHDGQSVCYALLQNCKCCFRFRFRFVVPFLLTSSVTIITGSEIWQRYSKRHLSFLKINNRWPVARKKPLKQKNHHSYNSVYFTSVRLDADGECLVNWHTLRGLSDWHF